MYTFLQTPVPVVHEGDEEQRILNKPWADSNRLQKCVQPVVYDISISPLMDSKRFYGEISITVNVTKVTNYFAVHSKNLTIKSVDACAEHKGREGFPIKHYFQYAPNELLVIVPEMAVDVGKYTLDITYEGKFQKDFNGLFKALFVNEKESFSEFIATKGGPNKAREIFPCFDEPDMKAVFKLKVTRPLNNYKLLASDTIKKEIFGPGKNQISVYVRETKPMPTFLLGFLITDLKESAHVEVNDNNTNLTVKLYTTESQAEDIVFSKDIVEVIILYFADFFQVACPVQKIDLVGFPDIPKMILNHRGLTIFNEADIVCNEVKSSAEHLKRVSLSLSEIICSQWFGDLVTLKWWDDYWLWKGFNVFMAYKALDVCMKSNVLWNLDEQMIFDVIHPALHEDSLDSSQPLDMEIEQSRQNKIEEMDLTRTKGAGLLKMVENFIGETTFKNGIRKFLAMYSFSSATSSDLWACMDEALSDPTVTVGGVINNWVKQSGYPVVYVIKRADTWILSQSKFLLDRDTLKDGTDSPFNYKWDIPIHYVTSTKTKSMVWFKKEEECLKVIVTDRTVDYIKFNHEQTGYYRVNYEGCLWRQFGVLLAQNRTELSRVDRSNLLDDAFHLAEAGQTDFSFAFEILKFLRTEDEYLPWATAAANLKRLISRVPHTPCYGLLMKLIRLLVKRLYGSNDDKFSWRVNKNKSMGNRLLGVIILELACLSKLKECITDLGLKFAEWIRSENFPVHLDLARILLCYGMREVGTVEDWDIVWMRYKNEKNAEKKDILLECLANVREQWAVIGLLEEAHNQIDDVDYIPFLRYLSQNPYHCDMHWAFIRNAWEYLMQRFENRTKEFHSFVLETASKFTTPSQLDEVNLFFKKYPSVGSKEDQKLVLNSISQNIFFWKRYRDTIANWLRVNLPLMTDS